MQTDYGTVLQWIYLFNSLALAQLAMRQLGKRRKGRQQDQKIKAAALGQWNGSAPDELIRQLGQPSARAELDHGRSACTWRGDRQLLEAFYQDGKCTGVELRPYEGEIFPNLNTYFNCAVLAALACSWKFLAAAGGMPEAGEALPASAAAKQYLVNFALFLAGAGLLSFILKRHQLLLSGGCIAMVALSLPLLNWP